MSIVSMTMQEALAKKKILESDITKRLSSGIYGKSTFVSYTTDTAVTINGVESNEYIKQMKSSFDSLKHLINNLTKLKIAINKSNAITTITVAGKEYTVADAIARYRALDIEKGFYNTCVNQYNNVIQNVQKTNDNVNDKDNISRYMSNMLVSESAKKNEQLYNTMLEDYKKNNLVHIVDPNNLKDALDPWANELNSFESEIHTALVTSNINTTIEVEFED